MTMGLFEFMFPEQAQAVHLRAMRELQVQKHYDSR